MSMSDREHRTAPPEGHERDGLIPVSGPESGNLPPAILRAFVIVAFLASLTATAVIDRAYPSEKPKLFGQEKKDDKRVRAAARIEDGTAARLFEQELRLTSPVRKSLSSWYAVQLYRYLDEAGGEVLAGKDGWLFMTRRVYLEDANSVVPQLAAAIAGLDRRLAQHGLDMVLAPIPRKAVICSEFLPDGVDPDPAVDEAFAQALRDHGVLTADVAGLFKREEARLLYFPPDGHWTELAEVLASEAIAEAMGILLTEEQRTTQIVQDGTKEPESNTFYFAGLDSEDERLAFLDYEPIPRYGVVGKAGAELQIPGPPYTALLGTSFSARRRIGTFIEHFSGERVLNLAAIGEMPLLQLERFIEHPSFHKLKAVVIEMPLHAVFSGKQYADSAVLYGLLPSKLTSSLSNQAALKVKPMVTKGMLHVRRKPIIIATTLGGRLAHTGDGAVALRIRGEVQGREIQVIHSGGGVFPVTTVWPLDCTELVLPMIAGEANNRVARWRCAGSGSVRVDELEL
ncbi:MAG: hypothetical protein ACI841_004917, partial [Planctomycetota bacterium]